MSKYKRIVVLDTETTGLDIIDNSSTQFPYHRITEIGAVEIIDNKITGKRFQTYLNPKRDVSMASYRITGLSTEFLSDKPKFDDVADNFLKFIEGSKLVIHNAKFDVKFLNFELSLVGKKNLELASVVDTLALARARFPGQKASLDALCKKYKIDNSNRTLHGALIDAQLLARVYLYMEGFSHQFTMQNISQECQFESNTLQKSIDASLTFSVLEVSQNEVKQHQDIMKRILKD